MSVFATVVLAAASAGAGTLIPDNLARRNGMTRAWFSQVQVDGSRSDVESVTLNGDILVAVTSAGVVHAMDAETGATRWTARVGNPAYPTLGPGVDATHVALVNGSTLYVLDRADGSVTMERKLGGAVGGGPTLTSNYAFVPLFTGRVEGYELDKPKLTPWYYNCAGRIFQPAVASNSSVMWSTDRQRLYVADGQAGGVRFRFQTGTPITAPPTAQSPLVYAGSLGGYVYAIDEQTGQQQWRYSAGFAVRQSPVVIGDLLLVATDEPALHAVATGSGEGKWAAAGVARFVAASESRVYGLSKLGDLLVLDRNTGAVQARATNRGVNRAVLNDQTDRLYLYSRDGLVQCFRELDSEQPYYHQPVEPAREDEPLGGADSADEPAGGSADEPDDKPANDPFGADDPFAGGDDPFGGGGGGAADDPFGGGGMGDGGGGDDPFGAGGGDDPFGGGDDPFN